MPAVGAGGAESESGSENYFATNRNAMTRSRRNIGRCEAGCHCDSMQVPARCLLATKGLNASAFGQSQGCRHVAMTPPGLLCGSGEGLLELAFDKLTRLSSSIITGAIQLFLQLTDMLFD